MSIKPKRNTIYCQDKNANPRLHSPANGGYINKSLKQLCAVSLQQEIQNVDGSFGN